jgi:hypothetical protein
MTQTSWDKVRSREQALLRPTRRADFTENAVVYGVIRNSRHATPESGEIAAAQARLSADLVDVPRARRGTMG